MSFLGKNGLRVSRTVFVLSSIFKFSTKASDTFKPSTHPSESANELIKMFNTRGNYDRAFEYFDMLIKRNNLNIKSLLSILDTCIQSSNFERGQQIEALISQSRQWKDNLYVKTSLIKMYMNWQMVDQAERIFETIRQSDDCDIVVYNTMLKGYIQNRKAEHCFQCVEQMNPKVSPDNITYTLLLNACTVLRDEKRGKAIHNELRSTLKAQHVHLQNALIDFYGKINQVDVAVDIFNDMNIRETSTYNSLMKAYLVNDLPIKVLELFEQMKEHEINTMGPLSFKPDLITFMAICDACEKLGLLDSPDSSYGEFDWKRIFSRRSATNK